VNGKKALLANHLYWCVSTTPDDDSELVQAKWLSLDNHVHDVHRIEGMVKYFQSAHMEDCRVVIRRKSGLKDVT